MNRVLGFSTSRLRFLSWEHCCSCATATFTKKHVRPSDLNLFPFNKKLADLIHSHRLSEARKLFDEVSYKNTVTWNTMITGYVKQKLIAEARQLFDQMPHRDVISWNIMLSGYLSCQGNRRYIEEGRKLFDLMPERDSVSYNTMISALGKSGRMDEAVILFQKMPERDCVSWNALITGFLNNGEVNKALEYFTKMPMWDSATLCTLVSGLARNGLLDVAMKLLLESDDKNCRKVDMVPAYNTLIAAYADEGKTCEARNIFNQLPWRSSDGFERNVVSWNIMMNCYVKNVDIFSARELFDQMDERDAFSWNTMINGYLKQLDISEADNLFVKMPRPDMCTWNLMISGYAQTGNMDRARELFEIIPRKNIVSWNSMLTGYERNGDFWGAIRCFRRMQDEGTKPDLHTLSSLICSSTGLSDSLLGMQIHQLVSKTLIPDLTINNALITMYSRFGLLAMAQKIFNDNNFYYDVVTWNAMIGGFAFHGDASNALDLFKSMEGFGVKPTYITFISVLHACAHGGILEEGRRIFHSMAGRYGVSPGNEHLASMVDMLGRHGFVEEAVDLIKSMNINTDKAIWSALLNACGIYNKVEIGRFAAEALMAVEPESSAPYVLLHNLYANNGKWDEATKIRELMEKNRIQKHTAFSSGNLLL